MAMSGEDYLGINIVGGSQNSVCLVGRIDDRCLAGRFAADYVHIVVERADAQ